ncbi:MAG: tRNA (adenosine(37)-N6)-threonylcarbamoyltransferase complex ATPase subunit type 1 TsaE [Actinomycetota bacterium]
MEVAVETHSPEETAALGKALAAYLKAGDVISLTGELGTGKTKFTQGLAEGLLITQRVTSPTFAVLKEYPGSSLKLYHFDAYRLDGEKDLVELGCEEYFYGDGVSVIEWGEKAGGLLPADALTVVFRYGDESADRLITLVFSDVRWQPVTEALQR